MRKRLQKIQKQNTGILTRSAYEKKWIELNPSKTEVIKYLDFKTKFKFKN